MFLVLLYHDINILWYYPRFLYNFKSHKQSFCIFFNVLNYILNFIKIKQNIILNDSKPLSNKMHSVLAILNLNVIE